MRLHPASIADNSQLQCNATACLEKGFWYVFGLKYNHGIHSRAGGPMGGYRASVHLSPSRMNYSRLDLRKPIFI